MQKSNWQHRQFHENPSFEINRKGSPTQKLNGSTVSLYRQLKRHGSGICSGLLGVMDELIFHESGGKIPNTELTALARMIDSMIDSL
jgi:hypothetical protein